MATITDTDPRINADPGRPSLLDAKHREELHASGLTDETIAAAGFRSVADGEIRRLLGWQNSQESINRGWAAPFRGPDGSDSSYAQVKLDFPRPGENGKPLKYESPKGKAVRAWFSPGFADAVARCGTIIVTEGVKKALAIWQATGLPVIALTGVWNWQVKRPKSDTGRAYGKRCLIADLQTVRWKSVEVVVCFDSDAVTNSSVTIAEYELAGVLTKSGATVRAARIPADGDAKIGADDYIVKHGSGAFRALLDDAEKAEKPPKPRPMDWARMLIADLHTTPDGRTIHWHQDQFIARDGHCYRHVADSEIKRPVLQWLDDRGAVATPRLASEVLECLSSEIRIPASIELPVMLTDDGPEHRKLVAMANGLLDIEAALIGPAKLMAHAPNWVSTFALPFAYDPTATCDTFLTTVDEIFSGDEERVDLLGEIYGYCSTAETKHQVIGLFEGPKRSGKGTLMRVLHALVGEANVVTPRLSMLAEPFSLQSFIGKTLALVYDAHIGHGDKAMTILETLKSISGEDSIEVHRKFLPSVSRRLQTKFVLACNELPKFGDSASALDSRLLILPFRNCYEGREDRDLEPKLLAELPGIFNFAMDGLRRLNERRRFTEPSASKEIRTDFARLVNPVRGFLEDRCVFAPSATVDTDDLFAAWRTWCEDSGHTACSKDVLGTRLRVLIPNLDLSQPRRPDGTRSRLYVGVGLKGVAVC